MLRMMRPLISTALLLACTASLLPAKSPVWLCVGSDAFREAARPLIEHRRASGFEVRVASPPAVEAIKASSSPPDFVLLLGDWDASPQAGAAAWSVPGVQRPYHGWEKNHPATFASDMALGDRDGDGVPDFPVGRIPAREAAQVRLVAEKIVRWETREPGVGDLALPVWAGDPGFAPVFRDMALGFLFTQIQQRAPLWAEFWLLQGDERSPFCAWPAEQPAVYNQRLSGGGLLSAMIGHGRRTSWWSFDLAGSRLEYSVTHAALMQDGPPAPPHVIFACSCGSYAARENDCLAEALLHAPAGPVLCTAASMDSHPLTNYYHSTALLQGLGNGWKSFGAAWIQSLHAALQAREPDKELLVRGLQPLLIGEGPAPEEIRSDHALLYNIFGDPATRLFTPDALEAEMVWNAGEWHWKVKQPPAGCVLRVQRRGPVRPGALGQPAATPADARRAFQEANRALQFETVAELPAGVAWEGKTAGPGVLRLVATGKGRLATAAAGDQKPAAQP